MGRMRHLERKKQADTWHALYCQLSYSVHCQLSIVILGLPLLYILDLLILLQLSHSVTHIQSTVTCTPSSPENYFILVASSHHHYIMDIKIIDLLSLTTARTLCRLWKFDYTAHIVCIVRPIYWDIYSTVKAKCATLSLRAVTFRFHK